VNDLTTTFIVGLQ